MMQVAVKAAKHAFAMFSNGCSASLASLSMVAHAHGALSSATDWFIPLGENIDVIKTLKQGIPQRPGILKEQMNKLSTAGD